MLAYFVFENIQNQNVWWEEAYDNEKNKYFDIKFISV